MDDSENDPQDRQARIEVVPSASVCHDRQSPQRTATRQKVVKTKQNKKPLSSGNTTFDEIIYTAQQTRPQSLARELSGTIKEILGTAPSVGCNDGCHPYDIIDDINSGTMECSAS